MPRARVCRIPGCPELTAAADGLCSSCAALRPAWQGSTRRSRLPADWSRIRARILRRDRGRCYICHGPASEVDHIESGDDHGPSNLAAICVPCHRRKSAQEGARARHRRPPP